MAELEISRQDHETVITKTESGCTEKVAELEISRQDHETVITKYFGGRGRGERTLQNDGPKKLRRSTYAGL